jgi:hypothetical protein
MGQTRNRWNPRHYFDCSCSTLHHVHTLLSGTTQPCLLLHAPKELWGDGMRDCTSQRIAGAFMEGFVAQDVVQKHNRVRF